MNARTINRNAIKMDFFSSDRNENERLFIMFMKASIHCLMCIAQNFNGLMHDVLVHSVYYTQYTPYRYITSGKSLPSLFGHDKHISMTSHVESLFTYAAFFELKNNITNSFMTSYVVGNGGKKTTYKI